MGSLVGLADKSTLTFTSTVFAEVNADNENRTVHSSSTIVIILIFFNC